ncbi:hypothetical protein R0K04_02195 [Pseudoalteromonas sp. SIMBA_153]
MRYLIFTFALISAFFVSAEQEYDPDSLIPAELKPSEGYVICRTVQSDASYITTYQSGTDYSVCYSDTYVSVTGGYAGTLYSNPQAEISQNDSNYIIGTVRYTTDDPDVPDNQKQKVPINFTVHKNGTKDIYQCPPSGSPEHIIKVGDSQCAKPLEQLEPDPDCPAPTDNDPFVFGSGGGQTSVCFPAPNGRQCEIQTDENGGYRIPASYGSAEPVSCVPDIDPSPDPDPTPDPDPKPDPDPTDPEPETAELDAINKINENLDVINNNQKTYSDSNDERLDRIALEIQNSNQILSDIKSKPVSSGGSQLNNGALLEIAENTKKDLYNGECEGELCDYDIQPKLDEENSKLKEWIEKEEPAPSILNTYTGKIGSYVSQNFAGFTGNCQPFILDVSIAGSQKIINVSQHCEPYETYFKPLVEWLLWTFTAIALINISSQSFRAFSSL